MAYTTIDKGSSYFNTSLWNGNNSTQSITGVGFAPDCVWIKCRSLTFDHQRYDTVRGANEVLNQTTAQEGTQTGGLTSFDSDGFTLGSNARNNRTGDTYCSWNLLAGGTASSNTDGSITSSVSASTTSGFSIVSYTGTGANATIGHGLGVAPKMVIVKNRSIVDNWTVGNTNIGWTKYLYLNSTAAEATDSLHWQDTAPTSSVFSVGTRNRVNGSGHNMIAFCFAEVKGFSKFGSYTGNGSTDGTFIYTGFKPAFFMIKRTDSAGGAWNILDNKRSTFNLVNKYIQANDNAAEGTFDFGDFLSNGFKFRSSSANLNGSGNTFIYMAFAESPFTTSTGIPVTAR